MFNRKNLIVMQTSEKRYNQDAGQAAELEAMREQMRSLRRRLDDQQIVSDRLMRSTVEQSSRYSRRFFKMQSLFFLPVGILSMFYLWWSISIPLWFLIFTVVFLSGACILDWHTTRLGIMDYGTTPLIEMQRRLVQQKRLRARRMLGGMVVLVIWLFLFVNVLLYDIHPDGIDAADIEDMRAGMFVGMGVGGVIGLILGIGTYLRMQRETAGSIRRIREYTEAAGPEPER